MFVWLFLLLARRRPLVDLLPDCTVNPKRVMRRSSAPVNAEVIILVAMINFKPHP
jgi:hypothetical protein